MQGLFNFIDILGKRKTGILIVVDHVCMNKLKEEKPTNDDAAELVEFPPHQLGPQKQLHWLKMTLTFTKK